MEPDGIRRTHAIEITHARGGKRRGARTASARGTGIVDDAAEERVGGCELAIKAPLAAHHLGDLTVDAVRERGVGFWHADGEARVARAVKRQVFDHDVRLRHEAGGETARRGNGPLHVVGEEMHVVGRKTRVPFTEALLHEPVAEPAAHRGFERGALPRELAGRGRPGEPRVRRRLAKILHGRIQRRTQVMPAHDHNLA